MVSLLSFHPRFKCHPLTEVFPGYVFKATLPTKSLSISFMDELIVLLVRMAHVNFTRGRLLSPFNLLGPGDFESTWHTVDTRSRSVKSINSLGEPFSGSHLELEYGSLSRI